LARILSNREIEFLGRSDEQLKIRGYRIEPGEIVKILDQYNGVEASAVLARERDGDDKSLVAYLVVAAGVKITATQLREHVSRQLPAYMVPASFVRVDAMPVTENGKVNRSALPAPDATNCLVDEEFIAPRTLVEQRLAGILSQLLSVKAVGVNDNFFFLGGHSLLGTQLLTRISQSFGVELSLLSLFDHPTLAAMSEEIEKLILAKLDHAEPQRSSAQQLEEAS
jgi:acyl carrier protein